MPVTGPVDSAGLVTVIEVEVSAVTVPGVVPKSTAVSPPRLEPVIMTDVPPDVGPDEGLIELTIGEDTT